MNKRNKTMTDTLGTLGTVLLFGARYTGKTMAAINCPKRDHQGVLHLDTEDSALAYFENQDRLIKMGILRGSFSRIAVSDLESAQKEIMDIVRDPGRWGTIVLDTAGQFAAWIEMDSFHKMSTKADKQSQVIWGDVRKRFRTLLIGLSAKCDQLIVTAHSREYEKIRTPRCNPALLELVSCTFELTRQPNSKLPNAKVTSRLPFFPPQINAFTMAKAYEYLKDPADWDNLKEEEKVVDELPVIVRIPTEDEQQE
jgi:hypothetical protein